MKEEIRYQWRIKWSGHWTTTRHHATEEQIRIEHPEAERLDHTRNVLMVPETAEESAEVARWNYTSGFMRGATPP